MARRRRKPTAGAGVQGRSPCLEAVGMVNTVKPCGHNRLMPITEARLFINVCCLTHYLCNKVWAHLVLAARRDTRHRGAHVHQTPADERDELGAHFTLWPPSTA